MREARGTEFGGPKIQGGPTGVPETAPKARTVFPNSGGNVRPMWGRDADGRPFLNVLLPWVRRAPLGTYLLVSPEAARGHGVEIFRDPSGRGRVVVRWS